jgi:hypothetical protein
MDKPNEDENNENKEAPITIDNFEDLEEPI